MEFAPYLYLLDSCAHKIITYIENRTKQKDFSILDIGTGTANLPIAVENAIRAKELNINTNYVGIDIQEIAIQIARDKTKAFAKQFNFIISDALSLKKTLKQQEFDIVIMTGVFYCLSETQKYSLIESISNFIKPEGFILISDYSKINLSVLTIISIIKKHIAIKGWYNTFHILFKLFPIVWKIICFARNTSSSIPCHTMPPEETVRVLEQFSFSNFTIERDVYILPGSYVVTGCKSRTSRKL